MKRILTVILFLLWLVLRADAALTLITTISVGSGPQGIAINPTTGLAYVANQGTTTVSVINLSTDAVTATIPGLSGPRSIAINSSTNTVYVTNYNGGTVSVINGATNTVTTTITVGSNPVGLALDVADSKLFVANYSSSSVSVINTSTNAVSATVSVFSNPYEVVFNAELGVVYVSQANGGNCSVDVINAATNAVSTTIAISRAYLEGLAYNSATNRLYVSATYDGYLVVINTITNTIVASVSVTSSGNNGQNLQPTTNSSANLTYTPNRSAGTVSVIDGLRNALLSTTSRSGSPFYALYYAANDRLYVTLNSSAAVAVYSAGTPTYTSQDNGVFETH